MASLGPLLVMLLPFLLPGQPTTQPTSPQAMVAHVPKTAQYVAVLDTSTLLPHIFSTTNKLANHPFMQNNLRIRQMVMRGLFMVKMQRKQWQQDLGFDPIKAIKYVTVAAQMDARGRRPKAILMIGGSFAPGKLIGKMAQMLSIPRSALQQKGNFNYLSTPRGPAFGWFAKGPIFVGNKRDLLAFAAAGELAPKKPQAGSAAAHLVQQFQTNSLLAVSLTPSQAQIRRALRRTPQTIKAMFGTMQNVHFSIQYKGSTLAISNNDAAALAKYVGLMRGLGMLSLSGDYATRGILQIIDTMLDPNDTSLPREIRQFAKHKGTLLPMIRKKMGKNPITFTVGQNGQAAQLKLQGNQGIGMGVILAALGGIGYLTNSRSAMISPAMPPVQKQVRPYRSNSTRPNRAKTAPAPAPVRVAPTSKPSKP